MSKSPDAFRTIREVADWLGVAAHVLRFWESKFSQIRPVKRAGGRRYYRPADMELVGGIKVLLHDRGMTVRGVQRMLREEGVAAVAGLSPPLDAIAVPPELVEGIAEEAAWHDDARAEAVETDAKTPELTEETSGVPVADARSDPEPEPEPEPETAVAPEPEPETAAEAPQEPAVAEPEPVATAAPARPEPVPQPQTEPEGALAAEPTPDPEPDPAPAKPEPEHETAGQGLDRLAAFVAKAKDIPQDNRPRLRPAITSLRRLKARMEEPIDGTRR
jgi:DNA-binding transcriptional MerR regulator